MNDAPVIIIKLAIGDPNTLLREGLKWIFSSESDLLVAAEAENDVETVEIVDRIKPDVLLLDSKIPKQGATSVLLELNERNLPTKVLILSLDPEQENILDTAKAGARGCILKSTLPATLIGAIRRIHGRELWVDRRLACGGTFLELARQTWSHDRNTENNGLAEVLSKRELEILDLLAQGLTNDEIRKRLFISLRTVKIHANHIFNKLNVNNRTQAAVRFLQAHRDKLARNAHPQIKRPHR